LNRLPHEKVRCLDVETSGLDWKKNAIVGYVLAFSADPRDSYYVPFRHAGNANVGGRAGLTSPEGWDGKLAPGERELVTKLDEAGTLCFGHNLAFDLRLMSRVGFKLQPRFEDTMINAPLLDEYVGKYSLAACADRHGVQAKKGAELYAYMANVLNEPNNKNIMGHYWRLAGNDRVGVDYARGDGTTTWQLRDAQTVNIQNQELGLVHDIESRLIPVLARMMTRGVKVDEERLEWLIDKIDRDVEQLHNEFPSGFNARSPLDVQAWMEKNGHTDWPRTPPSRTRPNGSPSFTSDYLERYDAGKKIIKLRKWENLNATFCMPLKERHLWNGRVHTTFNQLRTDDFGTVTGRLSSNDPNMQQVPKHDEELGALYRSIFVPDYGAWGERDYSQIEPRLMAYYTRARVFLDDYRNNPAADSHTAVAKGSRADWDQMPKADQKHYRNTWAKRVNQTVITGGGKRALVNKYKMTEAEAEGALAKYFRTVPELKPFQKKVARRFRERGWLISLLGRRCRLDDPDRDYVGFNRLLQTGNADILKLKMVEVDEFLQSEGGTKSGVELLLNCHDALSSQFQLDGRSRAVYAECKRIMEDFSSDSAVIKLDLPMRVDEGEGPNWSVATYGEEK
jgi:DNA polymerase-1